MRKKVIAAGHICLDITPVFPEKKVSQLTDILSPGKLIQMGDADVHTGGSVANTGLAMKLLGADVTLMGKVGADAFGEMICNILKKYDAADGMLIAEEESTSYSVVLAIPGIDRIFLHNPGANNTFRASDVPQNVLEEAALFHFGYPTIMKSMYENQGEELLRIMQCAKTAGAATSLDLSAVDADSEAGRADWDGILKKVLPYVDFFVPSVEELCFMLDRERFEAWQEKAAGRDITEVLELEEDIRPLADRCMDYGAKVLLIKCGVPGMYYRTAGRERLAGEVQSEKQPAGEMQLGKQLAGERRLEKQYAEENCKVCGSLGIGSRIGLDFDAWADKEGFEKSYRPDRVLSGTGAGDTSIAAFLTAMLQGCMLERAVQLAAATGASCVTAYDALSGLKSFSELEARIVSGWGKIG